MWDLVNADHPERKTIGHDCYKFRERGRAGGRQRERETWEKGQIQLTAFAKKWGGAAGWEWWKWITTLWKIRFLPIKFWEELWRGGPTIRRSHRTSHSGNWDKVTACNIFWFCFLLFGSNKRLFCFFDYILVRVTYTAVINDHNFNSFH